jgi:hypothetical protein
MSILTIPAARRSVRCFTAPTVRPRFFLIAVGRPALQNSDVLAEKVATAWPALRLARRDGLGATEVVARMQHLENALLGRVPTLDLVLATPIGLVRVIGLAIAELRELCGERFHVCDRHRAAGFPLLRTMSSRAGRQRQRRRGFIGTFFIRRKGTALHVA